MKSLIPSSFLVLLLACTKEQTPLPVVPEPEPVPQWQRFVGEWRVYDTTGVFLFDAQIEHFGTVNEFGVFVDSLLIQNFADTMDLKLKFTLNENPNFFNIGFKDSLIDYQKHFWFVAREDDAISSMLENELRSDTMVLYFRMTNIKFYINEGVPFFDQKLKQVYVRKP